MGICTLSVIRREVAGNPKSLVGNPPGGGSTIEKPLSRPLNEIVPKKRYIITHPARLV